MTDKWQSGRTYTPGSLVIPTSKQTAPKFALNNGDFAAGSQGWDYSGGVIFEQGTGYGSPNNCVNPGSTGSTGEALNTEHLPINPGGQIYAECMIMQGASDVDHTRGWVVIRWYDINDTEVGTPALGNMVNDGSGGAWFKSSVTAPAPGNCAYARAGIRLYQNSADKIAGDNLVVKNLTNGVPDGLVYKATQDAPGKSGATEPAWPGAVGVTVQDNEVTWEGVIGTAITWEAIPLLVSGDTEPTWPTQVGANVRDQNINWKAVSRRVEDENCPNSKVVAAMASKIFAADGDIVRFSATTNPLDWTSEQDAGYLPTGLQQANSNDVAVLAPYRGNLAVFNASSFQLWQVDPDPSAMALLDQMEGIGSTHQKAAHAVGNDLFYLSQLGVRSVSVSAASDNLEAGDVGMPIDPLVQAANNGQQPSLAAYYPSGGQYWLAFRDYISLALSGDLPNGTTGTAMDYQYAVTGGMPPYTMSVSAGSLPDGLTMDAQGHVTGTPTTIGTYTWTVQATDVLGTVATLDDGSTVSYQTLEISGTFPDAKVNVSYSETIQITGGEKPYSNARVTEGALPDGLSLSLQTDVIRLVGTPTGIDPSVSFTVAVDSTDGQTAVSAQTMKIKATYAVAIEDGSSIDIYGDATANWAKSQTLSAGSSVRALAATGDGSLLFASVSSSPFVRAYRLDVDSGFSEISGAFVGATTGTSRSWITCTSDGGFVVVSNGPLISLFKRSSDIWNLVQQIDLATGSDGDAAAVRFSPDDSYLWCSIGKSNTWSSIFVLSNDQLSQMPGAFEENERYGKGVVWDGENVIFVGLTGIFFDMYMYAYQVTGGLSTQVDKHEDNHAYMLNFDAPSDGKYPFSGGINGVFYGCGIDEDEIIGWSFDGSAISDGVLSGISGKYYNCDVSSDGMYLIATGSPGLVLASASGTSLNKITGHGMEDVEYTRIFTFLKSAARP